MATEFIALTSTGLAIGDLTWSWCEDAAGGAVSTTGATLVEIGNGIYALANPNVIENSAFRVYVTASPAEVAEGVFVPATAVIPVDYPTSITYVSGGVANSKVDVVTLNSGAVLTYQYDVNGRWTGVVAS